MMKPNEFVSEYFETHDTSEKPEICAKCNGQCCRNYAGGFAPWQLFDDEKDITVENIKKLLKENPYVLDCYEGYELDEENWDVSGWYIRPKHKPYTHFMDTDLFGMMNMLSAIFGVSTPSFNNHDDFIDRSYGGECVYFVSHKGCQLPYDKRPIMCQSLVAIDGNCSSAFGKLELARMWEPWFNVIEEAIEELNEEKKGGD